MVAGEASADLSAASLLQHLKKALPNLTAFGVGGENLKSEGMELVVEARHLSLMGIAEWAHKIPEIWGHFQRVKKSIRVEKPDFAILLDLPDFNLMMAKQLKKLGIPVIYYISPQVWAWRTYRVHKIKKLVDKMLVVFPFEEEFYKKYDVPVEFVGHPLLDRISIKESVRSQSEVLEAPRIALLPGSRHSELNFLSSLLNEVVTELKKEFPKAHFKIPVAPTFSLEEVKQKFPENVELVKGNSNEVRAWADIGLIASGTATLETALMGLPFCLFYKVSRSSSFVFKYVAKYTGWIGMPNVLVKKEVAPEFFQEKANVKNLVDYCRKAIRNEEYRKSQREELLKCRTLLGTGNGTEKAAASIVDFLNQLKLRSNPLESHGKYFKTQIAGV